MKFKEIILANTRCVGAIVGSLLGANRVLSSLESFCLCLRIHRVITVDRELMAAPGIQLFQQRDVPSRLVSAKSMKEPWRRNAGIHGGSLYTQCLDRRRTLLTAALIMSGAKSIPTTLHPRAFSSAVRTPSPHPTSRTRSPRLKTREPRAFEGVATTYLS